MISYILIALIVVCIGLTLFHIFNAWHVSRLERQHVNIKANRQIGMSILIPCYNEERIIKSSIPGMYQVNYENKEIIFINDGSSDATMTILREELSLVPVSNRAQKRLKYEYVKGFYRSSKFQNFYVIDKVNGGKADSLNAGADYASMELVVTLDADTILKEDALDVVNRSFQSNEVIAAGGMVHVLQGGRGRTTLKSKMIVRLQILEYIKGFYIYKASLAKLNALSIISGAFGIFNRDVLFSVGGYRKTIGEDIDVTMKFQKYKLENSDKKILFLPHAVGYTECPENWKDLFKQRVRWQKAFIDCVIKYFPVLIKTLFSRKVSFFFVVDSFLTGTVTAAISIVYLLLLPFLHETVFLHLIARYILLSASLNLVNSFVALKTAKAYGMLIDKRERWLWVSTIVSDLMMFRFVYMFYVVCGSFLYFVNKDGWNKVQRTGREYYPIEKPKSA
jgi:poly-beta-1,6-N-acetyl-D-glucosamine synthase